MYASAVQILLASLIWQGYGCNSMMFPNERHNGDGWETWVWYPCPNVLCTRAQGHASLPTARTMMAGFDRVAQGGGQVTVFHDWSGVTGYTTEARVAYVNWSKPHAAQTDKIHMLTQSRIVAMGISVASLVLPHLVSHKDRAEFERQRALATEGAPLPNW